MEGLRKEREKISEPDYVIWRQKVKLISISSEVVLRDLVSDSGSGI